MQRLAVVLLGFALGVVASTGASAQDDRHPGPATTITAEQRHHGRAGEDGREVATGDGTDTIIYGLVETGGLAGDATTTDVDPAEPAPPDLSRVPGHAADETTVAPPVGEPAADPGVAAPDAAAPGDATTADPAAPAAAPPTCADYADWYDAQLAYETAGGQQADPAIVAALDPDADGIACEEAMATS